MARVNPKRSALVLVGIAAGLVLAELSLQIASIGAQRLREARAGGARLPSDGRFRILCLGESTTAPHMGSAQPWPEQLERILNERSGRPGFAVFNEGVAGTNSLVILSRLPGQLRKYRPHLVVSMIGVNDGRWFGVRTAKPAEGLLAHAASGLRLPRLLRTIQEYLASGGRSAPAPGWADLSALRARISALERRGRISEAEKLVARARDEFPEHPWPHVKLSDIRERQGRLRDAEDSLLRAVCLRPENAWVHRRMAEFLERRGRLEEAAEPLERAMRLEPEDPQPSLRLAEWLARQGKMEEARARLGRYLGNGRLRIGYSGGSTRAVTAAHYDQIRSLVQGSGAKLACVQYPTLDPEELRRLFTRPCDLLVSNRENFREALRNSRYEEYFVDVISGQRGWGHCTEKGDRLIAERLAGLILEGGVLPASP